tara:strand:- start:135 stop:470 length:336 start_codon:yes stop_codon:yes gene_type:complete
MRHLLVEILDSILKADKALCYQITCDGDPVVELTRDLSLCCNQQKEDEYVGMDNLDEGLISIFKKDKEVGGMYWSNWNDGAERLIDYHVSLDDQFGIGKTVDKWEKGYKNL